MIAGILLQAEGGSGIPSLVMFGLLLLVMYFFFFRPQMKKQKEEGKFQESVSKGMRVVTSSGIHGKILEVGEKQLVIETENARMRIERSAISKELSAQYQQGSSASEKEKSK